MTKILRIAAVLSFFAASAYSADSRTVLFVHVYPEVVLRREGLDAVRLIVRLETGTGGWLWAAESCAAPRSNAFPVSRSGLQLVPLADLQASAAESICFASSDGGLTASLPALTPGTASGK